MDVNSLASLFETGGWSLVAVAIIIWAGKFLYTKIDKKFTDLSERVSELQTLVTDLKVESTRWRVIVESCGKEDCPNKKFLREVKE